MRKVSILGSTGSIGTQALDVVRAQPDLCVTALAGGSRIGPLEAQVREFRPRLVCVFDEKAAADLRVRTADLPVEVVSGMDGLIEAASLPETDIVLTALVGMVGIRPTLAAVRAGKDIALANKETLVTAGHLIVPLSKEAGVKILPVDSEHSAIFQCLAGNEGKAVSRILLTASGGPFRGRKREELRNVQVEDALKHPNWVMGRKITVDCSTMVNKGLEIMEARWLFGVEPENIEVVIQPQSIIHSMVEFEDGAVLAQLGIPDMKLPIQYALTWPERRPSEGRRLDFAALGHLDFEAPDYGNFPGLALARTAAAGGGSLPTVYNAANEWAVAKFLNHELGYLEITDCIQAAMEHHTIVENPDLEEILAAEAGTRGFLNGSRWNSQRDLSRR